MRGVFYRSDTRDPNTDHMFANGFYKRDVNINDPVFRFPAGRQNAPDIVPESAVCVTRHFEAAPLFPVGDLQTDSWVYVLDLDTADMTNTQQSQYAHVSSVGQTGNAGALWPMFGQERAVNSIDPNDIIGAVLVNRRFNGNDVFNGGDFRPRQYLVNNGYTGPANTAALATNLITPLIQANAWLPMPSMAQGVVRSTRQ